MNFRTQAVGATGSRKGAARRTPSFKCGLGARAASARVTSSWRSCSCPCSNCSWRSSLSWIRRTWKLPWPSLSPLKCAEQPANERNVPKPLATNKKMTGLRGILRGCDDRASRSCHGKAATYVPLLFSTNKSDTEALHGRGSAADGKRIDRLH